MKSTLDRLNLRPAERRWLAGVAVVVFIVLNLWLVRPHFQDWSRVKTRLAEAEKKLRTYTAETNRIPEYQRLLAALAAEGTEVPPEDQASELLRAIQSQAALSGVNVTAAPRAKAETNEFFVEWSQTITVQCGETQLVAFLYNIGSGGSMIRARELSLRPDPPRYNLQGNIKLVASYQKKPAARATAPARRPAGAAPATPTEKKS